jgi:Trypsin-like peptidase domain/Putative peptidoglycan binding domain
MKLFGAVFAVLLGLPGLTSHPAPAGAQDTTGSLPSVTPDVPGAVRRAAPQPSLRDSYVAIPLAERIALQSDLIWSGHYSGPINGEFSEPLVNAVKAFQKLNKTKQTGVLNPHERAALIALVRPQQEQVGWQIVHDTTTGARLGLPMKLVPKASPAQTGQLWSSAQGQVRIETFKVVGQTLEQVFERQKREPSERKIEHQSLVADSFAIVGTQGLKKLHVRGFTRNGEIRGITILYDQAMDGAMDRLVTPLKSSFQPFMNDTAVAQDVAGRRRVEYGTGIVVSSIGHIVTDLQVVDGCDIVRIPQLGHAERLAEDRDNDLALLRIYGAEDLAPLALLGEAAKGNELTLVGIADPQSQSGNSSISTTTARLIQNSTSSGTTSAVNLAPAPGFSGAAALDKSGRFFGMIGMRPTLLAGTAPAPPRAAVVPAETIRNFIEANYVAPSSGPSGLENTKAALVRVICVRK